jgi:hypothetical protein
LRAERFLDCQLGLVLDGLLFEMVKGSADRDHHVFGLGQADEIGHCAG